MICTIKNKFFSGKSSFPENTYILAHEGRCVIIDPGLDAESIMAMLENNNLLPVAMLATHGHVDHVGGIEPIRLKYNIPFYIHEKDVKLLKSVNFYLKLLKIDQIIQPPTPTNMISEQDVSLNIEGFEVQITNYPGHTDGSCVIWYGNNLFCGDLIFAEHFFTNGLPGENISKLRDSVNGILAKYPEETMLYPGHGSNDTLRNIKQTNKKLIKFLNNGNCD